MAPARHKFISFRPREFVLAGAIFVLAILNTSTLYCQWYKLSEFNRPLGVIYFLDDSLFPRIGFVGTGFQNDNAADYYSEVWKTTDGGLHWIKSIPTTNFPRLGITNFTFKDSAIGWLSGGHLGLFAGDASCYQTTDGGYSWFPVLGALLNSSSVHFNPTTQLLFASTWVGDALISNDLGVTWNNIPSSYNTNGFAFTNPNTGILSRVGQNGKPVDYFPFLRTIDGGFTWIETSFFEESWQPLAIQGTNTFFCAGDISSNVYRSDDAGVTWNLISNVPNHGHITGTLNKLYVHALGVYVSTDQGVSWKSICGPKLQNFDTRFYGQDNIVYAADYYDIYPSDIDHEKNGRLWVNTTGNGSGERLLMQYYNGNEFSVTPGEQWTVDIVLPDTFSTIQWLKLDSLSYTIRYQRDLFSIAGVAAATGWRVDNYSEEYDRVRVKLLRESGADRGVPVATVTFITNIADSVKSDVYVDSVFYNAGELTNCEIIPSEKLEVTVLDDCGDSLLREFIGREKFELVSLHPNPAKDKLTVDVKMPVRGTISVSLVDINARTIIQPNQTLEQGHQSFTLDLTNLFYTGAYQIILTFFDDVATGSFVLTK